MKSYVRALIQEGCAVREIWVPQHAKVGNYIVDAHFNRSPIIELEPRIRPVRKIQYTWALGKEMTRRVILENTRMMVVVEHTYGKE